MYYKGFYVTYSIHEHFIETNQKFNVKCVGYDEQRYVVSVREPIRERLFNKDLTFEFPQSVSRESDEIRFSSESLADCKAWIDMNE